MSKILIAPDSFKGTMSAVTVCENIEPAAQRYFPQADIVSLPVADGGEGTVDSFLYAKPGRRIAVKARNPLGKTVTTRYALMDDGTAVIEMAAAAGLPLVYRNRDVMKASTYGVGEQIADAIKRGAAKIVIGLGGSATNDAGTGALAALGAKFFSKRGEAFVPTGATLTDIARIDTEALEKTVDGVEFRIMTDIDNPLYGENGAAYVFAPQKGADAAQVELLDKGLRHFAAVVERDFAVDPQQIKGGGAAGGMGAGLKIFLNGTIRMGIDIVLDELDFDRHLADALFVISGEGKVDGQTVRGKVLHGIGNRCARHGVPLYAIVGDIADGAEQLYEHGVTGIFSINRLAIPFRYARKRAAEDLRFTADNLMRVLAARDQSQ